MIRSIDPLSERTSTLPQPEPAQSAKWFNVDNYVQLLDSESFDLWVVATKTCRDEIKRLERLLAFQTRGRVDDAEQRNKSFREQVEQAVAAGADIVLLDNMNLVQLRLAVQKCKGRSQTEASGGVTLAGARAIAETGVDFISVGAITHSARAVDIALDFEL